MRVDVADVNVWIIVGLLSLASLLKTLKKDFRGLLFLCVKTAEKLAKHQHLLIFIMLVKGINQWFIHTKHIEYCFHIYAECLYTKYMKTHTPWNIRNNMQPYPNVNCIWISEYTIISFKT